MGHKVNPVGLRVGINRDWNSKWFATGDDYAAFLKEDIKIRRYLDGQLKSAMLSRIEIGRVKNDKGYTIRVAVYVGRPGDVIGQEGENVKRLRAELHERREAAVGNVPVRELEVAPVVDGRGERDEVRRIAVILKVLPHERLRVLVGDRPEFAYALYK